MEHDRTSFRGAHSWRNSWPSTLIAGEAWSDMMEAHSKRWIPGTWEDAVQLCWHFSLSNFFSNSFQNHESEPSDLPTTFLHIFLSLLKFCFGDSEISVGTCPTLSEYLCFVRPILFTSLLLFQSNLNSSRHSRFEAVSKLRSHLSPWKGLLQAISERSGGGLFAIMRRNSAASEARWQIVATQLFYFFISFMVKQMVNALRKRLNDQWRTELTWKSVEWLFANEHVMCLYHKMCRKL